MNNKKPTYKHTEVLALTNTGFLVVEKKDESSYMDLMLNGSPDEKDEYTVVGSVIDYEDL